VIFSLPGSTGACRTAWNGILCDQLDSRHQPCNFANLVLRKPHKPVERLHQKVGSHG